MEFRNSWIQRIKPVQRHRLGGDHAGPDTERSVRWRTERIRIRGEHADMPAPHAPTPPQRAHPLTMRSARILHLSASIRLLHDELGCLSIRPLRPVPIAQPGSPPKDLLINTRCRSWPSRVTLLGDTAAQELAKVSRCGCGFLPAGWAELCGRRFTAVQVPMQPGDRWAPGCMAFEPGDDMAFSSEKQARTQFDPRPDGTLAVLTARSAVVQRHAYTQFHVLDARVEHFGNK